MTKVVWLGGHACDTILGKYSVLACLRSNIVSAHSSNIPEVLKRFSDALHAYAQATRQLCEASSSARRYATKITEDASVVRQTFKVQ